MASSTLLTITSLAYSATTPGSLLYILAHLPSSSPSSSSSSSSSSAANRSLQPKVPSHLKNDQQAKVPSHLKNDQQAKVPHKPNSSGSSSGGKSKGKDKNKGKHDNGSGSSNNNSSGSSNNNGSSGSSNNNSSSGSNNNSSGKVTVSSSVTGVIKMQDKATVTGKSNFVLDFGGKLILQGAGLDFADCSNFELVNLVVDVGSSAVQKNGVNGATLDCLTFNNCHNALVHLNELYHSTDETVNVGRGSSAIEFCNNIVAVPMNNPSLHNGELHAYGAVLTSENKTDQNTMHHNLFVSCLSRMPRFDGQGLCDFSNNVIVNPGKVVCYDGPKSSATMNFYNNVVLSGPNTDQNINLVKLNSSSSRVFVSNNLLDGQNNDSNVNTTLAKVPVSTSVVSAKKPFVSWTPPQLQQQAPLTAANSKSLTLPQKTDVGQSLVKWLQTINAGAKVSLPTQYDIQSTWVPVKLLTS